MVDDQIMVVTAHPDDAEFLFGGTMIHLRNSVNQPPVHILTLCNGSMGSREILPEDLVERRWEEAKAAAESVGATYDCCGFDDFSLQPQRELALRMVVGQLRLFKPNIVLTHSPRDTYMGDHAVMAGLVRDACFFANATSYDPYTHPGIEVRNGDLRTISEIKLDEKGRECKPFYEFRRGDFLPTPVLYFGFPCFGGLEGVGTPDFCVDISDVIDRKADLLEFHSTQKEWLNAGQGENFEELVRTIAERQGPRGILCESFSQLKASGFPPTDYLSLILQDKIISNLKTYS